MTRTCGECKHFVSLGPESETGSCKSGPPVAIPVGDGEAGWDWPEVDARSVGCGQFKTKTRKGESTQDARMVRPTPAEVTAYAASIGFTLDGEKFCSHYESKGWKIGKAPMKDWKAAVVTWKKQDEASGRAASAKKTKLFPIPGRSCSTRGCGMPAVYKNTGGQYDSYACSNHLPEKVKEQYE